LKDKTTLKIALIGAPNSGKTELAQQLTHALPNRNVTCVDDYIAEVEKRSDVVLGHYATYLGNVQAAVGRFEHERKAASELSKGVIVTCGTLVENSVYTATLAYITNNSSGGDTTFRMANDRRANLTMMWLGIITHDTWEYDLTYYLPIGDGADKWDAIVDQHIPEAAEALGVEYVELPVDRDARVGIILQEILELETTTSDGQASGNSSE
jgi:hypothetical protein